MINIKTKSVSLAHVIKRTFANLESTYTKMPFRFLS